MNNCENSPQAKWQSLKDLRAFLKGLVSKGKLPASLLDSVFGKMSGVVSAQYAAGANGSNMKDIVERYLPAAVASAQREAASSNPSAGVGVFGAGSGATAAELAGLLAGRSGAGSFFDSTRSDPSSSFTSSNGAIPGTIGRDISPAGSDLNGAAGSDLNGASYGAAGSLGLDCPTCSSDLASAIGGSSRTTGGVAVSGTEITSDEVSDYFNGYVRQDDDSFAILLWLGKGKNPMLMLDALSYAKRLHNDVVLPAATYYKRILYGDPNYPVRLGQILYGIVPQQTVTEELRGGPTSRHLLGQAGNFRINGIESAKVVEDIVSGAIRCEYGTIALTAAIHVSLPYYAANGQTVRNMLLWSDSGVPNFVGYKFN